LVMPAIKALLRQEGSEALLLVKPQFEVGRARVGKGGVVRDPEAHRDALRGVIEAAAPLGWVARGLVGSPITGPAGNHEYLLWLRDPAVSTSLDADSPQTQPRPLIDEDEIARVVNVTLAET